MASVNKVTIIGNLGADPEVRRMGSGDPVVNLRVACTDSWRDKASGEKKERTEWITVVIFNEGLAKVAEQYLRKGSKVYLEGALQTRKWQDQTGNDRYSTEVVLQKFRGELVLLDARGSNDDAERGRAEQISRSRTEGTSTYAMLDSLRKGDTNNDLDDEIPF